MNEYRVQRLKEDLTYAQQRNKRQKQQLANYTKVHEKDLKEIERLNNIIKEVREYIKSEGVTYIDLAGNRNFCNKSQAKNILEILDKG